VRTLKTHAVILGLLMSVGGRAAAQSQPLAASAPEPLALEVDATGLTLDEATVRDAIVHELALERLPSDAPRVSIALRVVSGGELTVTIHDPDGRDLSRSVAAPGRADEVPEVTALLVGNLARDEASGLLARLRQPEPASEGVAPAPESAAPAEPERVLPLESVNLSLFHPLSLRERSAERRFWLELGLFYGRIGALSGVAIEGFGVTSVVGRTSGLVIDGIGYHHGGKAEGALIGGLFGVGGSDLAGLALAGAATVESGSVSGAQVSGLANITVGELDGAQVSGALNVAEQVDGAQVSGLFNLAQGDVAGVQLSGGANLAERVNGMQISLVNIGGDVSGGQIGLVNVARDVDGVQLGLVNVAREVDGVSLGIVPYSSRGRTQALAWYDTSQPFNIGVRFHTGALYVMPTFGFDPRGNEEIVASIDGNYSPGLSLGYRFDIAGRGHLDLDVNESTPSRGANYLENELNLRYRLLGAIELTRSIELFAGGGLRHHFHTQGESDHSVKPELSLGIALL
jgi:hypothetical protein